LFKEYFKDISFNPQHAVDLWLSALQAPQFIKNHRLWNGFFDHKWVTLFSLIIAIVFSHLLIKNMTRDRGEVHIGSVQDQLGEEIEEDLTVFQNEETDDKNINDKIKKKGGVFFFGGGMKYLLLIFLEVLIFHFSVKTYSILKGKTIDLKFNDFYKAEIRMLKVMLHSLIKTGILFVLLSIVLKIVGLSSIHKVFMFLIYAYFLGHAFLDNYNEQHLLSIKASDNIIRKRFLASIALGIIASVIVHIPVLGPLTAPLFCSVVATLYGYRHQLEKIDPLLG